MTDTEQTAPRIGVVAATGRVGRALVRMLEAQGRRVVAVARNPTALTSLNGAAERRVADLEDHDGLATALADLSTIVSCAHARFARQICAAAPAGLNGLTLIGSTRRFTRYPDAAAAQVRAGEAVLKDSGHPWTMIHPTMIYGADGENNVVRIAAYIRRFGVIPLPDGGTSLIQPIHIDDVARALAAAALRPGDGQSIVVAGPQALRYADFVRAVARAIGRTVRIVPLPGTVLAALAGLTRLVPGVPTVTAGEVRRLLEDKAFDVTAMRHLLGVEPISLETGLRLTFDRGVPFARRARAVSASPRQSGFLD